LMRTTSNNLKISMRVCLLACVLCVGSVGAASVMEGGESLKRTADGAGVGCQRTDVGGVECASRDAVANAGESSLRAFNDDDSSTSISSKGMAELRFSATEEGGEEAQEDNLVPPLPPSARRRRWGFGFGLVALLGLGCLLWIYRHSLPVHRLPSLPHISLPSWISDRLPQTSLSMPGMPTLSSSSFTLKKPSLFSGPSASDKSPRTNRSSKSFRPDSMSLLRWSEEADPSFTPSSSAQRSSWRSKLPSISGIRSSRYTRPTSATQSRMGGLFLGELEEDGEYEEVGLLPSPRNYGSYLVAGAGASATRSYGSV